MEDNAMRTAAETRGDDNKGGIDTGLCVDCIQGKGCKRVVKNRICRDEGQQGRRIWRYSKTETASAAETKERQ